MSEQAITELLDPILVELGLELDDLAVKPVGSQRIVKITVDGDGLEGTGPDLDQIADATRKISDALDESDLMGEKAYTLEVSSRGVSKPLEREAHYRRNKGRLVLVQLADCQEPLRARIVDADDQKVEFNLEPLPKAKGVSRKAKPEDLVSYRYDQIVKAVVQIEMNRTQRS